MSVNINSTWKEIEWWEDSTNDPDQKVRWRVIARCVENVEGNYSNVYFYIQKRITNGNEGHANYPATKSMAITTGSGSTYHSATISWTFGECRSTAWADADGTYTDAYWGQVYHNADGTATIRAHITGDRVTASFSIDTYVDLVLPTIPRASTATVSSSTLTIGNTQVISTNRASDSFTHTVQISMDDYSVTYTGVGASVSWIADTAALMPYMDTWQQKVTIRATTYSGSTNIGTTTTTFTLQVDTSVYKPVITFGAPTDTNATTSALESSGKFIKGYAQLSQLVSVASNNTDYGDTVVRLQVTLGSTAQASAINASSGSMTFTATVTQATVTAVATDNRGYSVTETYTLDVFDYQPITISSVEVARVNVNEEPTETGEYLLYKITGKCFQGNFGQAYNTITVESATKLASATSYDPWVTETTETPSRSGYADFTIEERTVAGTYSSATQYDVIFRLSDALTSAQTIVVRVHEGVPVWAWGKDHFDVYGSFHIHSREDVLDYITLDIDSAETVPVNFSGAAGGTVNWTVFKYGKLRIAVCKWQSASDVTIGSSWATILTSSNQSTPDFPLTFANVLHKSIKYVSSANAVSADCWNGISASVSNTNGGQFYLVRPNDSGSVTANSPVFTMLVIGTI